MSSDLLKRDLNFRLGELSETLLHLCTYMQSNVSCSPHFAPKEIIIEQSCLDDVFVLFWTV